MTVAVEIADGEGGAEVVPGLGGALAGARDPGGLLGEVERGAVAAGSGRAAEEDADDAAAVPVDGVARVALLPRVGGVVGVADDQVVAAVPVQVGGGEGGAGGLVPPLGALLAEAGGGAPSQAGPEDSS